MFSFSSRLQILITSIVLAHAAKPRFDRLSLSVRLPTKLELSHLLSIAHQTAASVECMINHPRVHVRQHPHLVDEEARSAHPSGTSPVQPPSSGSHAAARCFAQVLDSKGSSRAQVYTSVGSSPTMIFSSNPLPPPLVLQGRQRRPVLPTAAFYTLFDSEIKGYKYSASSCRRLSPPLRPLPAPFFYRLSSSFSDEGGTSSPKKVYRYPRGKYSPSETRTELREETKGHINSSSRYAQQQLHGRSCERYSEGA